MKKTMLLMALAVLALSCAKENEINNTPEPAHKADFREVTLTAGQEGLTKTFLNGNTGILTWNNTEDPMAIFDGSGKQTFSHTETLDDGAKANFSGTADVNVATWTAVHPASHASWENDKVYVTFPCVQTARANGGLLSGTNTVAAQVTHTGEVIDDFSVKNVGGLLKVTIAKAGIKSITISSRGGEPLTGKAELSFDGSGNPVVTPVQYNYETFVTLKAADQAAGFTTGKSYFLSVFPGTLADGILIDMENVDGTVASLKSSASATIARSGDLEIRSGFDTAASWYTPEETKLTLDFVAAWPFNETIASGGTDPISTGWASDGEKVMTYTTDNNIRFYVHCLYYMTRSGTIGLRIKGTAGDYLLLPSIPGKSLKKVVVKHSNADTSHPAIMTRGGNAVVDGGDAKGNASADDINTWELSGTAHNMQYRYQLTNGATAFGYLGSLELTYISKASSAPVASDIVIDMRFYDAATDKALNPLTTDDSNIALNTSGLQRDFTSSSGTYTISGTEYQVTFSLGKVKILKGVDKRGLGLNNAKMLLPTIAGYRLSNIKTKLGGQAANNTDADPPVDGKNIHLSPTTNKSDKIWTHSFAASTMSTLPAIDEDLTTTAAGTDYYLMMEWGWCYMQYLTLTYSPVSGGGSSQAGAPALLLDGGSIVL